MDRGTTTATKNSFSIHVGMWALFKDNLKQINLSFKSFKLNFVINCYLDWKLNTSLITYLIQF